MTEKRQQSVLYNKVPAFFLRTARLNLQLFPSKGSVNASSEKADGCSGEQQKGQESRMDSFSFRVPRSEGGVGEADYTLKMNTIGGHIYFFILSVVGRRGGKRSLVKEFS